MFTGKGLQRWGLALELLVLLVAVGFLTFNSLRRMDYLGDSPHIRMTDSSRTALVAKNIAEGRGYTTNDLPAALVDFYDTNGKLHDENWVNADRFPFAAYATAVLYKVTGSTSWKVGILWYNVLFFIAFLVMLYVAAREIFEDRYAGVFAATLALLHPYTFQFLYWKDGDMLFLATAAVLLLHRYYKRPPGEFSRFSAVMLGSVLAFVFLARPNLGLAFLLFFGIGVLWRVWNRRREAGLGKAFVAHLTREGVVFLAVLLWCVPFMIHSMREWGTPLFSANSFYQLPLGTHYGMGTDTWWKYQEPGNPVTLSLLRATDAGLLWSKFTSSWVATLKNILSSYPIELALGLGAFIVLGRATDRKAEAASRPFRIVGWAVLFAFVANLIILPLYSFQDYSFRHYLAFALPLIWIAGGRAISLLCSYLQPTAIRARDHVLAHARWYIAGAILVVLAWNFGAGSSPDAIRLFARTSKFVGNHWLGTLVIVLAIAFRRWLLKPPWLPRAALAAFLLVFMFFRTNGFMKRTNFSWFPFSDGVWKSMRERSGVVSSFALQGEVAWNTGRKNIPAPEWPMHIYSFLFDHKLEIEDVYLESSAALISEVDGPFALAAPGFEGYARLQEHRYLPGYEVAFHEQDMRGYSKFGVKPRLRASTDFKLVDRAAVKAMAKSPDRIELGAAQNAIYAAHGWERYATLDGKQVISATNLTRRRYPARSVEAPWEDSSITFFLDERRPRSVDLDVYAVSATTYEFYWNLDLYSYTLPKDRKSHSVGKLVTTAPGWYKVHLEIPAPLLRTGLNKLGFRAGEFRGVAMCPQGTPDEACLAFADKELFGDTNVSGSPIVVRPQGLPAMVVAIGSLFAGALEFRY